MKNVRIRNLRPSTGGNMKEQAEKWKGKIDVRAYEALMNYTVEITD